MATPQNVCQQVEATSAVKDNTRTTTRRFYCPQCAATFARSSHMRRHQRTRRISTPHSGPANSLDRVDKPFTCRYCPLASSRKDAIIRHTRTFHPGQLLDATCKENEQTEIVEIESGASHESPLGDRNMLEDPVCIGASVSSYTPIMETPTSLQMPLYSSHADFGGIELNMWLQSNGVPSSLSPPSHGSLVLSGSDNVATFQGDFDRAFNPQLFDLGTLAPLNQLLEIGSMPQERWNVQSMPPAFPEARTPTLDSRERKTHPFLDITVDAHSQAKGNLSQITKLEKHSDIFFPSRPSMARFVRAYFTHMAPYVPVVHVPTFDVASLHRK